MFHSLVVMNRSSRRALPASMKACRATPTLFLVAITLGAIEMAKAGFQGVGDRLGGDAQILEQGAEANGRHLAGAVIEGKPGFAKCHRKWLRKTCLYSNDRGHGRSLY